MRKSKKTLSVIPSLKGYRVAIVIPCYKVNDSLKTVLGKIPRYVEKVYIIDDASPEEIKLNIKEIKNLNFKIQVIRHQQNSGVGAAMKTGYLAAIKDSMDIIIKIDGDDQMDLNELPNIIEPIVSGSYEYAKGNRFFSIELIKGMPKVRLVGNLVLSFLNKLSTGYYDIFDPNNGFTGISKKALLEINLNKVDDGYFFESDMLFNLGLNNARVKDVPMKSIYGSEKSNLSIMHSLWHFLKKHIKNIFLRLLYTYFIRDFRVASIQLLLGPLLLIWGGVLGITTWVHSHQMKIPSQPGTIVLVAVIIISGLQLTLSFFSEDINRNRSGSF